MLACGFSHGLSNLGSRVHCLSLRPESLSSQVAMTTEVVAGVLLDPASLSVGAAGLIGHHQRFAGHPAADVKAVPTRWPPSSSPL
jgi:hypothetical protein